MEIIQKGVMRSGNVLLRLILNHIFNEAPNSENYNLNNFTDIDKKAFLNTVSQYNHSYRFFAKEPMKGSFISKTTGKKEGGYPNPNLHSYEKLEKNNILIIPWRDPRDSIISFIRTEWSKIPPDPMFPWKNKFPTLDYIKQSCEKKAKEQIEQFNIMIKMLKEHPKNNTLELKYENYHNDFDYLFNLLEKYFKIKIVVDIRDYLKAQFNKESTTQFQKKVGDSFNNFCNKSHVHGGHVYKGDNKWNEILTPEILDIINPILDPYIKKWESL